LGQLKRTTRPACDVPTGIGPGFLLGSASIALGLSGPRRGLLTGRSSGCVVVVVAVGAAIGALVGVVTTLGPVATGGGTGSAGAPDADTAGVPVARLSVAFSGPRSAASFVQLTMPSKATITAENERFMSERVALKGCKER
jgi:hypothetical protein